MTTHLTDWFRRFAPLAAVALLFGVLTPFARFIGSSAWHMLDRPVWPAICAGIMGCGAFFLCARVLASKAAPRALVACVFVLVGPLLFGRWLPGLILVGSIGATVLIPMLTLAIALSRAPARGGAGGVAALVSLGPIAALLTAGALEPRIVFLHLGDMDAALAIGTIALAGSALAAWLLPWSPPHEADGVPVAAGHPWARVGSCMALAALGNLTIDRPAHMLGALALYLLQAVGLPIAAALCILPLNRRSRAGLYLAATLVGRFVGAAASVGVEYVAR